MSRIKFRDEEFIVFVNYLIVYLNSGYNLYISLNETEKLLTGNIKALTNDLIAAIKSDKTILPFHNFSKVFNNQLITQILSLLFQNNKAGKINNNLEQLLPLLERLKMQVIEDRVKREQQLLNNYLLAPLLGSVIVSIYFSTGILTILVGNLYG